MKRFLPILFCAFTFMICSAQNFDEVNLIGSWNVASATGQWNNQIKSFDKIVFGDAVVSDNNYGDTGDYENYYVAGYAVNMSYEDCSEIRTDEIFFLYDFFISNGNKLHIIFDDGVSNNSVRLIIKEFNNETLKLESFDGKSSFVLTKDQAAIPSVNTDSEVPNGQKYDLMGRKVENPQVGNIYIQNHSKFIAR